MYRFEQHPLLEIEERKVLTFYYNSRPVSGREGDTIAAALTDNGIRIFRTTAKHGQPRGLYCAIGQCTDCVMVVDGQPNVRTCVTLVKENMRVETQHGLGGNRHETL